MSDEREIVREWLRKLLESAPRGTKSRLAEHLGVRPDVITRMLNNEAGKETREIRASEMVRIAEFFQVDPPISFVSSAFEPSTVGAAIAIAGKPPQFGGHVQAGAWLGVDEYFQQDEAAALVPDFVVRVPRYAKVRQYAYQVHGDSVNRAGIDDGMWVVVADALDFIDHYGEIESGDLVVVERTRAQGAERELTIKEIRYYRDRYELLPKSTNTSHQPIVVPHNHNADDGIEVRVVGVVLSATRSVFSR